MSLSSAHKAKDAEGALFLMLDELSPILPDSGFGLYFRMAEVLGFVSSFRCFTLLCCGCRMLSAALRFGGLDVSLFKVSWSFFQLPDRSLSPTPGAISLAMACCIGGGADVEE